MNMKRSFLILSLLSVAQLGYAEDNAPKEAAPARPAPRAYAARPNFSRPAMNQGHMRAMNGVQRPLTNSEQGQWRGRTHWNGNGVPNSGVRNRIYTPRENPYVQTQNSAAAINAANAAAVTNAQRNWRGNYNRGEYNGRNYNGGNYNGGNHNRGNYHGGNWAAANNRWERNHHDRGWWRSHYNRFSVFGGGYYYWDNGWWYPAYGYDPYFEDYSYNAPLYSYQDQDPGQVIMDVQRGLQQQGFYRGPIDGEYGPMTRRALIDFQRENGLPESGQIDDATLGALGMQ
jgi:hypothetical protein